jgi:ketosteroid isomerase-like protein
LRRCIAGWEKNMDYRDIADALFAAVEAGDIERVREIYTADARIWHNFDNVEQSVDENLALLGWLIQALPERRYDVVRREPLPDGFLQQHVLRGVTRSGDDFALPACMICRIEGEQISRIEEYLDMGAVSALGA